MTDAPNSQREFRPSGMTVFSAKAEFLPVAEEVGSGGIMVQPLLSSVREGEMTALRAQLPPGANSNWHSHPHGQFLLALQGSGLIQCEGEEILSLSPGDSVWIPADVRHRHGAPNSGSFTYLSIQQVGGGSTTYWASTKTSGAGGQMS